MTVNYSIFRNEWIAKITEDDELSSRAKLVAFVLVKHMNNKTGKCYPSEERMASQSSLSVRTVRRAINELKDAGYLLVKKSTSSASNYLHNEYMLQTTGQIEQTTGQMGPTTGQMEQTTGQLGQTTGQMEPNHWTRCPDNILIKHSNKPYNNPKGNSSYGNDIKDCGKNEDLWAEIANKGDF